MKAMARSKMKKDEQYLVQTYFEEKENIQKQIEESILEQVYALINFSPQLLQKAA